MSGGFLSVAGHTVAIQLQLQRLRLVEARHVRRPTTLWPRENGAIDFFWRFFLYSFLFHLRPIAVKRGMCGLAGLSLVL